MVMTEITAIKGANEAVDVTASFKSSPARVGNPSKPSLFSSLDFFNWSSSSLFAPPSPSPRGCANLGGGFGAAAESDDPNGDFTAFATFANGLLLLLLLVPSPFSSSASRRRAAPHAAEGGPSAHSSRRRSLRAARSLAFASYESADS